MCVNVESNLGIYAHFRFVRKLKVTQSLANFGTYFHRVPVEFSMALKESNVKN
jgi:hypothetical protein